jgi:hypothetical protein
MSIRHQKWSPSDEVSFSFDRMAPGKTSKSQCAVHLYIFLRQLFFHWSDKFRKSSKVIGAYHNPRIYQIYRNKARFHSARVWMFPTIIQIRYIRPVQTSLLAQGELVTNTCSQPNCTDFSKKINTNVSYRGNLMVNVSLYMTEMNSWKTSFRNTLVSRRCLPFCGNWICMASHV